MLPEKNILNIEAPPGYDKIYFFLNKVTGRLNDLSNIYD